MSLDLGSLDGRIELGELIGQGGMGEVHKAWDRTLARAVAVKFIHGTGAAEAERLLIEARLQARVEHPRVVRVLEVGTLAGRPCILFQLVTGRTLQEWTAELPTADLVELVRQAATGLHAAHLQGLVHRDVKPGNILVEAVEGGTRSALVTDFGLAHGEEGGLTRSGMLPGTLDFMAPEQLAGVGPIDFRSDVYALGATLYAVLAGRPPFRVSSAKPEAEEQLRLLKRILDEEAPALTTVVPGLPGELSLIVAKAMEKDPSSRYPTAEAFAEDLARFQRGEPILARQITWAERAFKWIRRNPTTAQAIGAVAAILLIASGFTLWLSRQASVEALEASRLGAEAEQMHELIRVEMLLPSHDLSPAYARIRAMVAPLAARPSATATGAAAFTLGRGLQLLGDHTMAHRELKRAWDLGFRRPATARALSESESRLYAREVIALGRIDDPARKKDRLDDLAHRFRDPAATRLKGLVGATEADRQVLAARLALVEQRFDDAASAARRATEAGADAVEAGELEGEALLLAGNNLRERGDLAGASQRLAAAADRLQQAAAVGRSAPAPRVLLARVRLIQYDVGIGAEGFRLPPLEAIVAILREAETLDPENAELHAVWSGVEKRRGDAQSAAGVDPMVARRSAVAHAERAETASPSDPRIALLQLANASYDLALELNHASQDSLKALARGIAAAERAQTLSPDTSGPVFNLAQLHQARASLLVQGGKDGRAAAEEAVADGRRFLALGDRPVTARVVLAKALESLAIARWFMGGEGESALTEGLQLLQEASRMAPTNWGVLEKGLSLAATAAEQALAEGRSPEATLRASAPWADRLLPLAKDNIYFAYDIGVFRLQRARAELAAGRDPGPLLAEALPLLLPSAKTQGASQEMLGLAALTRAAWSLKQGKDPIPALRRAEAHGVAAARLDPDDADAPLLEARALVALPHPATPDLDRARKAIDRCLALNPRQGQAWVADARLRRARGDLVGARASLERAAALQPRLAEIAKLRALLGPG